MTRRKLVTSAERSLLLSELQAVKSALERTDELLAEEPTGLRDGLEAREKLSTAQSALVGAGDATRRIRQTSALEQLLAAEQGASGRELPEELDWSLADALDRLGTAVEHLETVDRELAANRPDRASQPLEAAGEEIRTVREQKRTLEERIEETRRRVADAPESDWLDAITSIVPIEVIAGWTAIQGIIGVENPSLAGPLYWAVFGVVLFATYLHVRRDLRGDRNGTLSRTGGPTPTGRPTPDGGRQSRLDARLFSLWSERVQAALAVGAFVVWVYYLEGPFAPAGLYDSTFAAVLLPLYTLAGVQLVSSYTAILARLELGLRRGLGVLPGAGAR